MNNVYIASLPRSGSTLMGLILNQAATCSYIGESFYWNKIRPKDFVCSCGEDKCSILNKAYGLIQNNDLILSLTETVPKIDAFLQDEDDRGEAENVFLHELAAASRAMNEEADIFRDVLGSSTIVNSSSNIVLGEFLTDWKLIVILRDPRGVINSLKKAAFRHEKAIPANLWIPYVNDFAKRVLELKHENAMIVKYEDLCSDAASEIRKICDFVGIDFNDDMLLYRRKASHVLMANRMRLDQKEVIIEDDFWKNELSSEERNAISANQELKILFNKLGYII